MERVWPFLDRVNVNLPSPDTEKVCVFIRQRETVCGKSKKWACFVFCFDQFSV